MEKTADWNKIREDVARLIYFMYFGKHEFFEGISLLRKQGFPCLMRGSLAYKVGLWKKGVFGAKFLVYRGETFFRLILSETNV